MSITGVRRTPICSLGPTSSDFMLVAIIIAKRSPRTIITKKDNQKRAVWNFTVRDSPADYVNVSVWGSPEFVLNLASQFHVGDVVDIIKASMSQKKGGENDAFLPAVTSSVHIVMNENRSEMSLHDSDDCSEFFSLLRLPTKPPDDFLTLTDIHGNGNALKGHYVNLLVAVRSIEPVRNINTRSGTEMQCREVVVMDQTHVGLTLIMWDEEDICRVASWSPRDTILFLADVRLDWSNFRRGMSATVTSRSIITENPNINEAMILRSYARTAPTKPVAILNHLANNIVDVNNINSVMSCQTVWNKAVSGETSDSFTALVYAHVHHLDLDGVTPVTVIKCSHCTVQVDDNIGICMNSECPTSTGADIASTETIFDLRITLVDHTGCLPMCRLTPVAARDILGCTETEFDQLTLDEKTTLKWKYLLKRCSAKLVVLPSSREQFSPLISVAALSKVSLTEYAARMPMY